MPQALSPARRPVVALLLFPSVTDIDVVGPRAALAFDCDVLLVWKNLDPLVSDTGLTLVPTTTLADCPEQVDVLLIPGGAGTPAVIADAEVMSWVVDIASRARYVTAFCTGSLVLAAAGLLDGYRAATHWMARSQLAQYGVENVNERVVVDRDRITGGGATAGIDVALTLIAELLGQDRAELSQLLMEYDPRPPFDAGSPERAPRHLVESLRDGTAFAGFDLPPDAAAPDSAAPDFAAPASA